MGALVAYGGLGDHVVQVDAGDGIDGVDPKMARHELLDQLAID